MPYTINGKVATTLFETTQTKVEIKGGLPVIKQKQELTQLKVIHDYEEWVGGSHRILRKGTTIYVRGESCKHSFAREIYEDKDGTHFILVPYDLILAVEQSDAY